MNSNKKEPTVEEAKAKAGVKETPEGKCEICKKRQAQTQSHYHGAIVEVCLPCFDDILEEE